MRVRWKISTKVPGAIFDRNHFWVAKGKQLKNINSSVLMNSQYVNCKPVATTINLLVVACVVLYLPYLSAAWDEPSSWSVKLLSPRRGSSSTSEQPPWLGFCCFWNDCPMRCLDGLHLLKFNIILLWCQCDWSLMGVWDWHVGHLQPLILIVVGVSWQQSLGYASSSSSSFQFLWLTDCGLRLIEQKREWVQREFRFSSVTSAHLFFS